jgi:hypothetical protein
MINVTAGLLYINICNKFILVHYCSLASQMRIICLVVFQPPLPSDTSYLLLTYSMHWFIGHDTCIMHKLVSGGALRRHSNALLASQPLYRV